MMLAGRPDVHSCAERLLQSVVSERYVLENEPPVVEPVIVTAFGSVSVKV